MSRRVVLSPETIEPVRQAARNLLLRWCSLDTAISERASMLRVGAPHGSRVLDRGSHLGAAAQLY